MYILWYIIPLCIFHTPLNTFSVKHDVFKRIVERDESPDVMINVLTNVHGERSAALENGFDSVVQWTFPSVDIAFDEYKLRVRVKLDKFFDEELGDFDDGLVRSWLRLLLACYIKGKKRKRDALHRSCRATCQTQLCHMAYLCLNICNV